MHDASATASELLDFTVSLRRTMAPTADGGIGERGRCPLLALSGHELVRCTCSLLGGKADIQRRSNSSSHLVGPRRFAHSLKAMRNGCISSR